MNTPPLSTICKRGRRGSALLVSLLFSAIIAISLGSFLQLANNATRLSYRTYYLGVGMNIAETGLEQALWSINRSASGTAGAWDDWESVSANTWRRTIDLGTVEGGSTAQVKVYARERSGASMPLVIARAIITPPRGEPVEKWIKVTLSRRSALAVGGLGREGIRASGNNVYFASWNSDPDNDDATPFVQFSEGVKNANMSLATLDLDAELNSGQADVNGKAAVGSDDLDDIKVGTQGYIGPFGTAAGVKDPDSVSTDFTADLSIPEVPSATYTALGAITASTTLPRGGDTPVDGVYYYTASEISLNNSTLTITPGSKVVIDVANNPGGSITVGGGSGSIAVGGTLTTNTLTGAVTYVPAELVLYTSGDVSIGGQGSANELLVQNHTPASTLLTETETTTTIANVEPVYGKGRDKDTVIGWSYDKTVTTVTTVNEGEPSTVVSGPTGFTTLIEGGGTEPVAGTTTTNTTTSGATAESYVTTGTQPGQPICFQLYGTRTPEEVAISGKQSITISGNGNLSGVVNAPYADISAKGGGNSGFMYGSLIGASLTFTGNDCFYYDESLADEESDSRFGIDNWAELVSNVDRTTYGSLMNF